MRTPIALLLLALPAVADALEDLDAALKHINALELDEAEGALGRVIAAEPDLVPAYVARARLRARRGDAHGAAEDALAACEKGRDLWQWAIDLAEGSEDYTLHGKACEGAYRKHGDRDHLSLAAESFMSAGDYGRAAKLFGEAAEEGPPAARLTARMHRGNLLSLSGDSEAGLKELDAVIAEAGRFVRAYQLRGRVKLRLGDVKGALADYEEAQRLNPRDSNGYLILGLAYYDVGDHKRALEAFDRAISAFAEVHRYTFLYRYLARRRIGDAAQTAIATKELVEYLGDQVTDDEWLAYLIRFLLGQVTVDALLEQAAKGAPDARRERLCEAHGYIGQMAMIEGDRQKTAEHFRKCLATKVGNFMEYSSSEMELRKLEKK